LAVDAKSELRPIVAARRREAMKAGGTALAERVRDHLLAEPAVTAAVRVALYAALPDELPTRPLFDALAAAGIRRLLPRLEVGGRLSFAAVFRWDELAPGAFHVLAPAAEAPSEPPGPGDVVLVPGLAFDERGRRLGWGGGYYDRTFPVGAPAGATLIGMACEAQLVESVPVDSHDRAMDAIVTERGLRWIGEKR
jgi:5-formyltetrahydrofolate cyclo-ligase